MKKSRRNDREFNAISAAEQKASADNDNNAVPRAVTAIPQHALQHREIFLQGQITRESAHSVVLQMRALARQNKEPVTLWINSVGGSVYDGLAIFDTMRDLMSEGITLKTVSYGLAASMGSFLLSAGSPGHRTMLPNAREMTHQPSRGLNGANEDQMQEHAKALSETRDIMESHYAHFMGLDDENPKTRKLLKEYMSPDVYLNAYMAQRLGLIDNIAMQNDGKPGKGIKDEFLRKSVEIDIRLNKRQFDNIDSSPGSTDPRRHVKRLIRHRDKQLKTKTANNKSVMLVTQTEADQPAP